MNWQTNAPQNDDYSSEQSILEVVRNQIYFYSEINRPSILALTKTLQEKLDSLSWQRVTDGVPESLGSKTIDLHIQSFGGGIFAGFSAMDTILKIQKTIPVNTYIDGCCASAGTFLSVVGTRRFMHAHSFMLIHQLSAGMWGNYEEFKDNMQNLKLHMKTIRNIYATYTKMPKKILNDILKKDLWFNAKKCLKLGLIDEII